MASLFVRIEKSCVIGDEPPRWMVLFNGVQQGGMYDLSGAGNREFDSEAEAREWAEGILKGIDFEWED